MQSRQAIMRVHFEEDAAKFPVTLISSCLDASKSHLHGMVSTRKRRAYLLQIIYRRVVRQS
jgi:hypothetical protein